MHVTGHWALGAVAALTLLAVPTHGLAQPLQYPTVTQVPQGVGCYWYRGRLNCNRYCYWEIDGQRYCTRRLRDAHSQAPDFLVYDYEAYAASRGRKSAK